MTLRLSSACSNQLSYRPVVSVWVILNVFQKPKALLCASREMALPTSAPSSASALVRALLEARGFEPLTRSLQSYCSTAELYPRQIPALFFSLQKATLISALSSRVHFDTILVSVLLRKEVIQPQVPLRLPCYDFIPVTTYTVEQ